MAYLSCVKDVASREIVAYEVTISLSMEIVYRTLKKLKEALDGNVHPEAMIHSDQGFQYTHPEYQQRVKKMGLTQSVSRRATASTTPRWNPFSATSKMRLSSTGDLPFRIERVGR